MKDYLVRGIAFQGLARVVAVDLTNTVYEAQKRHDSMPTATAALGRLMVAAAAMSSTLKDRQKISLLVRSNGPLESIIAECNWQGEIRGYVKNPHLIIPPLTDTKLNVAAGVGQGMLYVTKDLGFGEPYRGSVELISGEIALDIAQYFVVSEQIPTVFAAGVLIGSEGRVKHAGGYLVQLLPGATDQIIDILEKKIEEALSVTTLLSSGYTPEKILNYILGNNDLQLIGDRTQLTFQCTCNRQYLSQVLQTLGSSELKALVDQQTTEVCCQFCNETYNFSQDDIMEILKEILKNEETSNEKD